MSIFLFIRSHNMSPNGQNRNVGCNYGTKTDQACCKSEHGEALGIPSSSEHRLG